MTCSPKIAAQKKQRIGIQYRPVTTAHTCVNFRVVTMRMCNRGSRAVKAVVHNHGWLKSTRDLEPCVVKSHA